MGWGKRRVVVVVGSKVWNQRRKWLTERGAEHDGLVPCRACRCRTYSQEIDNCSRQKSVRRERRAGVKHVQSVTSQICDVVDVRKRR